MASLSVVILSAKALKGGRHKIRVSLAHNSETRYLPTDIIIDSEKEFKNGMVIKRPDASYLNLKLRKIVSDYQFKLDEIQSISCLSCAQVITILKQEDGNKMYTIAEVLNELLDASTAKNNTKRRIKLAFSTISRYIDQHRLVSSITHRDVNNLVREFTKAKFAPGTIREYMVDFRRLINFAIKHDYATYKVDPFIDYTAPPISVKDSWLSVDDIVKLRDAEFEDKFIERGRDIFMLSYYLGGINLVDLLKINFKQTRKKIKYVRQKTDRRAKINKYVEFEIPNEALNMIKKHTDDNGFIKYSYITLTNNFRHKLAPFAKSIGIDNLVYYSARKSFAQHAFELGIPSQVIDYILGHNLKRGNTCLYAYISVTPKMATDAVRKVLDNLK